MSSFPEELVAATTTRIGEPFVHHFKPDLCQNGMVTIPACMERGMDSRGYDCSGLIIASVCEVIGVPASSWPTEYRHVGQMQQAFTTNRSPQTGDILYMHHPEKPWYQHTGIMAGPHRVIHASGDPAVAKVVESWIDYSHTQVKVIDLTSVVSTLDM